MMSDLLSLLSTIFSVIASADLLGPALIFFFGALVGAWFYRYTLKRDPAKLELWAKELNELSAKAKDKLLK